MTRLRRSVVAVLLGVLAVGCGAATEPTAVSSKTSATPEVQLVLEPAKGTPIVTFGGLVNGGQPIAADLASLDALPTQSLTIIEPFVKKSMTFTGVAFADLLTAAKATGESISIHALDDFEATIDSAVLREPGVLLATRVDGDVIGLESGGPARLVFPPSSEAGKDTELWVWSIDRITVK